MYLRTDRVATYTMMTISMLAAITLGAIVSRTEGIDSDDARAMTFAIVGIWGALELFTIVLHAARYGTDGLSVSMGVARLSIVNYFGALALNMSAFVLVPNIYFTGSRVGLAVACGAAAAFLGREAMWAYQDLSIPGRIVLASTLAVIAAALIVVVITF